jgi:ATP synthase protein I
MDERDTHDTLSDLGRRLDRARRERERAAGDAAAEGGPRVSQSALGLALRIGTELVVAIVVGTGIGWALDRWLGTHWLAFVFFFLGVGVGMVNVWRAVTGMGMAIGYRQQQPEAKGQQNVDWSDDEE